MTWNMKRRHGGSTYLSHSAWQQLYMQEVHTNAAISMHFLITSTASPRDHARLMNCVSMQYCSVSLMHGSMPSMSAHCYGQSGCNLALDWGGVGEIRGKFGVGLTRGEGIQA